MKRIILPLIVSLLLSALPCLAAAEQESDVESYDYTQTYAGRFESDQLYQRSANKPDWQRTHDTISDINCDEALDALQEDGTWTGNLSREGECLGSGEAPERTSGNYRNYLNQKTEDPDTIPISTPPPYSWPTE
jgi:hypothetical protein